MKYTLFLLLCIVSLDAACTDVDKIKAKKFYSLALNTNVIEEKIFQLNESLSTCYSPEIEANCFILKAEKSKSLDEKVGLYKKSLTSISKFKNLAMVITYQNKINHTLAMLLRKRSPKLSKIYGSKIMQEYKDIDKIDYLWIYIVFGGLFLWGVYKNIRMHREK